jgi:hypothetical protein
MVRALGDPSFLGVPCQIHDRFHGWIESRSVLKHLASSGARVNGVSTEHGIQTDKPVNP